MVTRMIGRGWVRDRRASVALEMALMFPLVAMLLVGFSELYFYARAVVISERVIAATADMLAKRQFLVDSTSTASSANLGTHILAAETMAQPLDLKGHGMLIFSGVRGTNNGPVIAWQRRSSYSVSDTASILGKQGAAPVLPPGIVVLANTGTQVDTLIVAELIYKFQPFRGVRGFLPSLPLDVTVRRTAYARGRWGGLAALQVGNPPLPTP